MLALDDQNAALIKFGLKTSRAFLWVRPDQTGSALPAHGLTLPALAALIFRVDAFDMTAHTYHPLDDVIINNKYIRRI